jgi:hypothetical protein
MATKKTDYIPKSNLTFDPWQINLVAKVNLFKASWSWPPEVETEWTLLSATVGKKKLKYDSAWTKVKSKIFDAADTQLLKDSRKDYESGDKLNPADTSIRMFVNRHLRYDPLVTNDQKIAMGLIVPDDIPTPVSDSNSQISGNELVGKVRTMKHLIHFSTVTYAGQLSKAKGEGVDEIEVFIAFTDADVKTAPALSEFKYDGVVKRGLYTRNFDASQEGLHAWYYARLRIKGKNITFGPPSDVWGAIIP